VARGFARYGFTAMRKPLRPPIDPLTRVHPDAVYQRVYGAKVIERIDDAIDAGIAEKRPALFLVVGPSGGGRTSVTNLILSRFAAHPQVNVAPANLIVPDGTNPDHDKVYIYRNWMKALQDEVSFRRIALPKQLATDFDAEIARNDPSVMAPGFRGVLRQVAEVLRQHPQPHAFACRLENIPTLEFVTTASEMFKGMHAACVFTALDNSTHQAELIEPFGKHFDNEACCLIRLPRSQGESAARMIKERWEIESTVPLPFESSTLARGFGMEQPIGRILVTVERMLKFKFTQHGEGDPYPTDPRLGFTDGEFDGLMAAVDNADD